MHGHKRGDTASSTVLNEPVGTYTAPAELGGNAGKNEAPEDHVQKESVAAEDEEISAVTPWTSANPYLCLPKEAHMDTEQFWILCAELALEANKEKILVLREGIDKLLIFASLFSAVVTAFIIESYKLLRPERRGDVAADLLLRIQYQLDRIAPQNTSATLPPLILDQQLALAQPSTVAVNVNALWFISLMLSLGTAFVGIFCLLFFFESVREPRTPVNQVAKRIVATTASRTANIKSIILTTASQLLSACLLLSLILFGVGLRIFLSEINGRVMNIVTGAFVLIPLSCVYLTGPFFRFSSRTAIEPNSWIYRYVPAPALGALSVARSFPWDPRAIYAFLQSTEGLGPDATKRLLQALYRVDSLYGLLARPRNDGWQLNLNLFLNTDLPRDCHGLHKDIFTAYVLDRFALRSPAEAGLLQDLVGHRFELLLRVLNGADAYMPSNESPACTITSDSLGEVQIANFISIFFADGPDHVVNISTECRIQYCESVWMYMRNARVQRVSFLLKPHPAKRWSPWENRREAQVLVKLLVPGSSSSEPSLWTMDTKILPHVYELNRRLAKYVAPNSTSVPDNKPDTVKERIAKVIVYVTRIFDVISPGYTNGDQDGLVNDRMETYKSMHPLYMDSITKLVVAIQYAAHEAGDPDDLLGTFEKDGWKRLLELYKPESIEEVKKAHIVVPVEHSG